MKIPPLQRSVVRQTQVYYQIFTGTAVKKVSSVVTSSSSIIEMVGLAVTEFSSKKSSLSSFSPFYNPTNQNINQLIILNYQLQKRDYLGVVIRML